ncbi:FAD-binding oxidoreductase [Herbaspirillum sp. WGmk3]|jgi:glycine/D-amino acid oxidase-like deaminating enzyme|uniref:FAD-binding oxidoreductase n=1 Tax=Herbaspirillum huttiense subsp. lycopersici TaxID=3074428 RepID=A0ABU2EMS9_9BURK|nr:MULTISPECIES: FAD-binding oxidoreductase [Herbaspirillum]MCO4857698.1 FAD-binding oxidoreductase [Herbaspirillum sp. WGmk3]MDR6741412.1 glycine/D-amino acid oxidase-like deaminating enzyme [Herbaspirillum sp. 1173]MDR9849117.1 FAD-binding oxidoreductase [Herbaspirillum huttiense SE1]
MISTDIDTLVIGGGVVGMSIAYGLSKAGERVLVLDEGDDAFRAARGNFGLVWVQGKGEERPDYARWSMASVLRWSSFAQELTAANGIDLELQQIGGLQFFLDEDELRAYVRKLENLRAAVGDYPFEVLDPVALKQLSPHIGPEVVGAVYGPRDGHVSPLRLLRSLVQRFHTLGGILRNGVRCEQIVHRADRFHVQAGGKEYVAGKLVLAAGLGNRTLGPMVGLHAPVAPNRGQVLVTERMQPFLRHPSGHVRQTGEGVVQIGDSKEDVGFDDRTSIDQLAHIAHRARKYFPLLDGANVVRTWGALRVMTPDGFPIYEESRQCPGAFLVTCHSGITLAAMHAGPLADWIRGAAEPAAISTFKAERFHVQVHADGQ